MQEIKTTELVKRYKDITAVDKLNLDIEQGELFSLLGVNGAGKTTIINLLMRFYDVTKGEILIDGRNIKTYPLKELRQKFGIDIELEIDNNVNTDKCTVLGTRWYKRKPRFEKRDIKITATTLFDEDNYELIMRAMHGKYAPQEDGYNYPHECISFHDKVMIRAQTCEDRNEFIVMYFPWCVIEVDPIEANEGVLEASLTITPEKVKTATMKDGTKKLIDIFVQVVNDQEQLSGIPEESP